MFLPQADAANEERATQLSTLVGLIHEESTEKEILSLIETAEQDLATATAAAAEARVLEIEKKSFLENERIPS